MDFGADYINVFYHYNYDMESISKAKKKMLLKQIDTFTSSPFLCELMIDYPIDFVITCSQFTEDFIRCNNLVLTQNYNFSWDYYNKLFKAKCEDKRLKNLKIRLLLIEKLY